VLRTTKSFWEHFIPGASRIAGVISGAIILSIMGLMTAEVLMRYFIGKPIEWELDVVENLLIATVFLGGAYTLSKEGHVRVDIVLKALSPYHRYCLLAFGHIMGLIFMLFLSYYVSSDSLRSYRLHEMTSGIVPLPYFPVKLTMAIGSYLLCLQLIAKILQYVSLMKNDSAH
jgi:TRAP-type mannitol/chloroaromatic compound transport system permease small subunit